jgi:hypothetical protein
MNGRREIVSLLKILRSGQPYMQHAATNFRVKVTGDTATMDIFRVVPFAPTRETLDAPIFGARYESRLRRDRGIWKFERASLYPRLDSWRWKYLDIIKWTSTVLIYLPHKMSDINIVKMTVLT